MQRFFLRGTGCFLLLLCLFLTGCGRQTAETTQPATLPPVQTEPPTEAPTEPPSSPAMDALLAIYANADLSSTVDYPLISFLQLDGINYVITWTTDAPEDAVTIVSNEDGTVTVDVNELCSQDTPYTLTATVATADGRRVSHSWDCVLPKALTSGEILAAANALSHGERLSYPVTLTGRITAINKDFNGDYNSTSLTIAITDCDDQPVRCYGLQGEGIDSLQVGDTIAVQGILARYSNVLEFDSGCTLEAILE